MKLTQPEKIRYNAGLELVKIASTARTLVRKPFSTSGAVTVPKEVGKAFDEWLKIHEHVIYGSLPTKKQTFISREARDVDLAVNNPKATAHALKKIFDQKSNLKTKIIKSPGGLRYAVQVFYKGEWTDAADIHSIGLFYGDYDVYGSTLPPYEQEGIKIQKLIDQLLRKANSVMAYDRKEKRFGPKPDRIMKDSIDFVNVAKMLIASKRVRAEAGLARVKKAERDIKVWENYVKQLKEYGEKYKVHSKHISKKREDKFIEYSLKHPTIPVKDLIFTNGKVEHVPRIKQKPIAPKRKVVSPYDKPDIKAQQTEIEQLLGLKITSPTFEMGGVKIKTKYPQLLF